MPPLILIIFQIDPPLNNHRKKVHDFFEVLSYKFALNSRKLLIFIPFRRKYGVIVTNKTFLTKENLKIEETDEIVDENHCPVLKSL